MKQNQRRTILDDIINELADIINNGEISNTYELEQEKKKVCRSKGWSRFPSNDDIKKKLTVEARLELFGDGEKGDNEVADIFAEASHPPHRKKPLFGGYTKQHTLVRS